MLIERVASIATLAARDLGDIEVLVATDDHRIRDAVTGLGLDAVMTDPEISSGSGRALAAMREAGRTPDFVVNLQGDAPSPRPPMSSRSSGTPAPPAPM